MAGWVRGKGLLRRRLGADPAARLAAAGRLERALEQLAATPYGSAVHPGMDLEQAQRAVQGVLLWHMRILAGWGPASGVNPIRTLAAGFEITNVVTHLNGLSGGPAVAPYELGSLSTAWTQVRRTTTAAGVRTALARSAWGDPGGDGPGTALLAMRVAWARRVVDEVPPAAPWARSAAAILWSGIASDGDTVKLTPGLRRQLQVVLGRRFEDRPIPAHDPWQAEASWWLETERRSRSLLVHGQPGTETIVGVVGLLAADAWRVNAALAMAGCTGADGDLAGLFHAVA